MQVSLDGGVTYVDAPEGVRVIYRVGAEVRGVNPVPTELHINLTGEGVVLDVWRGDACVATHSETAAEVADRLTNEED